jgi:hypothetical protein
MFNKIRWEISVLLLWLFFKTMPRSKFKYDVIDSLASLREKYPEKNNV